jgi:hypothetical protein
LGSRGVSGWHTGKVIAVIWGIKVKVARAKEASGREELRSHFMVESAPANVQ